MVQKLVCGPKSNQPTSDNEEFFKPHKSEVENILCMPEISTAVPIDDFTSSNNN